MITYRWIEGKELERLKPVFDKFKWSELNPYFSKAIVAEDEDGEIIGFNVLQMVAHPEPLYVEKEYRGSRGVASELASQMTNYLRSINAPYWMIRTNSPHVAKLCIENGMVKSSASLFEGGRR